VLQIQLDLYIEIGGLEEWGIENTHYFEGSIIELFAQLAIGRGDAFRLLLELGAEFFDPSIVLLSFVGSHEHEFTCQDHCLLSRLLQLGATANFLGYMVTPL